MKHVIILDHLGRYVPLACEYKWSMCTYLFICTTIKVLYKYFKNRGYFVIFAHGAI